MFSKEVIELEPAFIGWRRYLHENPELSFEEFHTTEFLINELKKMIKIL